MPAKRSTKKKGKNKVATPSTPTPTVVTSAHSQQNDPPSSAENQDPVIAALQNLKVGATTDISNISAALVADLLQGLSPGRGLLGTPEEELKFHDDLYTRRKSANNEPTKDKEVKPDGVKEEEDHAMSEIGGSDHEMFVSNYSGEEDANGEIALGDYEPQPFEHDFVELEDGRTMHILDYFHKFKWDKRIEKLYSLPPMKMPKHMAMIPRDFQLHAAAQGLFCLNGPLKLFLLGDETGVGKTLSAILMMWAKKDEPGMSIVLCPRSVCETWVDTINNAWEAGYGLRAALINDSRMPLTQLLAEAYDIVVCSFEFFERNTANMASYYEKIEAKANDLTNDLPKPTRPTSCLGSNLLDMIDMPFKICVLDEAQKVNKRDGVRHQAIRNRLSVKAFVALSGTFPHNKWHDFSGVVDFAKNSPVSTHSKFLHLFSSFGHSNQIEFPDEDRKRLLQKFLQAFTIVRPASMLNLPECERRRVSFELFPHEVGRVHQLTEELTQALHMGDNKGSFQAIDDPDSSGALELGVAALMASLHPMLGDIAVKKLEEGKLRREMGEVIWREIQEINGEATDMDRNEWLRQVKARQNLIEESGRVTTTMRLYKFFRNKYPGEKIVIFSSSLRYLDIIAEALLRQFHFEALRFDGTVRNAVRPLVIKNFESCNPEIPLLCTIGAGGVGGNLQTASIAIISEPQWNKNTEAQAHGRIVRQGQQLKTKAVTMSGVNSAIDSYIIGIQTRKMVINEDLMRPLVRLPGAQPNKIELLTYRNLTPLNFE